MKPPHTFYAIYTLLVTIFDDGARANPLFYFTYYKKHKPNNLQLKCWLMAKKMMKSNVHAQAFQRTSPIDKLKKKRLGNKEVCLTCVFCWPTNRNETVFFIYYSSLYFRFVDWINSNNRKQNENHTLKMMKRKRNQQHTITNMRNLFFFHLKSYFFHVPHTILL